MRDEIHVSTAALSVGYDGRAVTDDINIEVRRGEILVLIGPNGAGKSTLLKTITRQLAPVGGVIELDGRELAKISARELATQMSVVLTERINPELFTCRDVVAMGRYPYTDSFGRLTAHDEEVINESLHKVNGTELADRHFDELSDGQRQRIMLARALCQEPDIMVLDEPTSYLDIRYKVELLNILRNMAQDGITVILSLHETELACRLADRIVCINGREKPVVGTPDKIFGGDTIQKLFGITGGTYDSLTGGVELRRPEGEPDVLVIGGCGSGINTYRLLQRKGIPFYAGLLFENDLDMPTARALAAEVVSQEAFTDVSEANRERMYELLDRVSHVIDCGCAHGRLDEINSEIIARAHECGKVMTI